MVNVKLIAHTPEPEKVVASAAKLCYAASDIETLMDGLTPEKTEAFLEKLASLGHSSPTEHASFTFGIEGVSRAFLAQMTRHRIASFSVQSQRYVRLTDFKYVIPPEIERVPEAKAKFIEAMNDDAAQYLELVKTLEEKHTAKFMAEGMNEKAAKAKASKIANEDARFLLPNACETKMIVTMNVRSLHNFFKLRMCNRAQWEIKAVAEEMFKLCYGVSPILFKDAGPSCACGNMRCSEGSMSCGDAAGRRMRVDYLKECAEREKRWRDAK